MAPSELSRSASTVSVSRDGHLCLCAGRDLPYRGLTHPKSKGNRGTTGPAGMTEVSHNWRSRAPEMARLRARQEYRLGAGVIQLLRPAWRLGAQKTHAPARFRFVGPVGKRDISTRGLLLIVDDLEVVERWRAVGEAHQFLR